jgi:hypothetical protein
VELVVVGVVVVTVACGVVLGAGWQLDRRRAGREHLRRRGAGRGVDREGHGLAVKQGRGDGALVSRRGRDGRNGHDEEHQPDGGEGDFQLVAYRHGGSYFLPPRTLTAPNPQGGWPGTLTGGRVLCNGEPSHESAVSAPD